MARPIWCRLLAHLARLAVSRALFSDGSRIEISSAMMPMTTSSSTRVKPLVLRTGEQLHDEAPFGGRRIGRRQGGQLSVGMRDMMMADPVRLGPGRWRLPSLRRTLDNTKPRRRTPPTFSFEGKTAGRPQCHDRFQSIPVRNTERRRLSVPTGRSHRKSVRPATPGRLSCEVPTDSFRRHRFASPYRD